MEDPLFEPWSVAESDAPSPPATDHRLGPIEFLRRVGTERVASISRRLSVARHETAFEDLLDDPQHLLRFELRPWPGPFTAPEPRRSAMLEIGPGPQSDACVTAWYWLDGLDEAPHGTATVSNERLTAAWIEGVIFDFVNQVLKRS